MVWDGAERRSNDRQIVDLTNSVQTLSQDVASLARTSIEMHRENLATADTRQASRDAQMGQVISQMSQQAEAIHTLALAVQTGDSKLAQDLAVHIASPHHIGTIERLNTLDARVDGHDTAIGKLNQRLRMDEGRRAEQEAGKEHSRWRGGLIATLLAAASALVGALIQAWVSWTSSGGGHPRP